MLWLGDASARPANSGGSGCLRSPTPAMAEGCYCVLGPLQADLLGTQGYATGLDTADRECKR
eukprot:3925818-Prymnesium_polylepis.1